MRKGALGWPSFRNRATTMPRSTSSATPIATLRSVRPVLPGLAPGAVVRSSCIQLPQEGQPYGAEARPEAQSISSKPDQCTPLVNPREGGRPPLVAGHTFPRLHKAALAHRILSAYTFCVILSLLYTQSD